MILLPSVSNRLARQPASLWIAMLFLVTAQATGCLGDVDEKPTISPAPVVAPVNALPHEPFAADLDFLLERLRNRLNLMPQVARWKWSHSRPIEDAERERLLTDRFVEDARQRGLDAYWSRQFITAQIAASRRIQADCFDRWKKTPPDEGEVVIDLVIELRPLIESVTAEMLEAVVRLEPHRKTAAFRKALHAQAASALEGDAISDEVRRTALAPWLDSER